MTRWLLVLITGASALLGYWLASETGLGHAGHAVACAAVVVAVVSVACDLGAARMHRG